MLRWLMMVAFGLLLGGIPQVRGQSAPGLAPKPVARPSLSPRPTPAPGAEKPAAAAAGDEAAPSTLAERRAERAAMQKRIDEAVAKLKAEAEDIDKLEDFKVAPVFKRPHPALANFGPEMSLAVLDEMQKSWTGNVYRDTYIRWHLMEVWKKARFSDRAESGPILVDMIEAMPDFLRVEPKDEYRDEPPEIAAEWRRAHYATRVVVGYPPFQKVLHAPAAFEYLSGAKLEEAKRNYELALSLRDKWKRIVDKDARAFNHRIRAMNWMVRQFRGELVYEVLKSGDSDMLLIVERSMERLAKNKSPVVFDLMAFLYLAAFDGVLNNFEPADLARLGKSIEKIARQYSGYQEYGRIERNFTDYAFHMIYMLRDIEGMAIMNAQNP